MSLSHFNDKGRPRMVDVSGKNITVRRAMAQGTFHTTPEVIEVIQCGKGRKGDVLGTAQIAGIMGAKDTSRIIPMCHPLPLTSVTLDFVINENSNSVSIQSEVKTEGKTGVEMEALSAVSIAALTIYDMTKSMGYSSSIGEICLVSKEGGKSDYGKTLGRVISVNTSPKKGTVKKAVPYIRCLKEMGIDGDAHKGPGDRQVSLLARESIQKVEEKMETLLPFGSFGENITTEGISLHTLPVGTKLHIGEGLFEVSKIGKTCHTGCEISRIVGECVMPKEGIFIRVLEECRIKAGDTIQILNQEEYSR